MLSKEKTMIIQIVTSTIAIFIAIIAHEIAHGYVAWRLGDNTAKISGRLSLNPLKHIDIFGTIILPAILFLSKSGFVFGWAKPVPVDYNSFKHKKRDIILVASAGIVTNIILACVSAIFLKISLFIVHNTFSGIMAMFWLNMTFFNILFAVFNILPIPPLDGSKILLGWSDNPKIKKFLASEKNGIIAIITILFILPTILQTFGLDFNPLAYIIRNATIFIADLLI